MATRDGSPRGARPAPGRRSASSAARAAAFSALGTLLALSLGCASMWGGQGGASKVRPDTSAFVVTLGTDTVMAERYVVDRRWTEGDLVDRSPTTSLLHYEFSADPRGHLRRFEATVRADSADTLSDVRWTLHVLRLQGGFDVTVQEGTRSRHAFVKGSADAIPLVARSIGMYQLVTRRLRAARTDSLLVPILDIDSMRVRSSFVRAIGGDSVMVPLVFPSGERARVDSAGRILGVSGLATPNKWLSERVSHLDVEALARSFVRRDDRGDGSGGAAP